MPPSFYKPLEIADAKGAADAVMSGKNSFIPDIWAHSAQLEEAALLNKQKEMAAREAENQAVAQAALAELFTADGAAPSYEQIAGVLGRTGQVGPYVQMQNQIRSEKREDRVSEQQALKTAMEMAPIAGPEAARSWLAAQGFNQLATSVPFESFKAKPKYQSFSRYSDVFEVGQDGSMNLVRPARDRISTGDKYKPKMMYGIGPSGNREIIQVSSPQEELERAKEGYYSSESAAENAAVMGRGLEIPSAPSPTPAAPSSMPNSFFNMFSNAAQTAANAGQPAAPNPAPVAPSRPGSPPPNMSYEQFKAWKRGQQ